MKVNIKKIVIISVIVILILILRFTEVGTVINLEKLTENRDEIKLWVEKSMLLSIGIYIMAYIIIVSLSIPGASILTITGGFLFGPYWAVLFINIGATMGSAIVFLFARYLIGNSFQKRYELQLEKFNRELELNGTHYLLSLRLIPIFPFFLINILAGLTTVKFKTFLWTTALGIIPGSFIYAYLGYAGGTIGESENPISREVFIALILLGLLALIPVILKKLRGKRDV